MTAPVFDNTDLPPRFYALSSASQASAPGYWAGYCASSTASFGPQANLREVWEDAGGVYLFLKSTPTGTAGWRSFLAAFLPLLPRLSPTGALRMLWIDNTGAFPWCWRTASLDAVPVAGPAPRQWKVWGPAQFSLGEYCLNLSGGSALTLLNSDETGYGVGIASAGLTFLGRGLSLQTVDKSASIPFDGSGVGAFTAQLTIPATKEKDGPDPLQQLGVMLRYACPDRERPAGETRILSLPVLRQGETGIQADLAFDPLHPLLPERSHLNLAVAAGTAPNFASGLATPQGYAVSLTPRPAQQSLPAGRLAFCKTPVLVPGADTDVEAYCDYYLAPDGSFDITLKFPSGVEPASLPAQLMPGISGAEYVDLATGGILLFGAGKPAYAPLAAQETEDTLNSAGTTAHITVLPSTEKLSALKYYAQPLQSPLFMGASDLCAGFLDFHAMPSGTLPSFPTAEGADIPLFPAGAYRWIAEADIPLARELEAAVLAPSRRKLIPSATSEANVSRRLQDSTVPLAVSPQGLIAELTRDGQAWAGLLVANMPASKHQRLELTRVGPLFQKGLQSNQLFIVVSNVVNFFDQSSVGPDFAADIEGWNFNLSPDSWRTATDSRTMMIFKFCNRTLADLAADGHAWGWREAAWDDNTGKSIALTQKDLVKYLADTKALADKAADPRKDPYAIFWNEVAINPLWNGILFINAPADFARMPEELRFLAAGLDPAKFYAHHVGFSVTPFKPDASSGILPGQTAAFGLIDYREPQDLVASQTIPFGFKTLQLMVRFANAHLADFAAQAELMVNTLFLAPLTKRDAARGNNLIMRGTYQRVGGLPSYSFVLDGENLFFAYASAMVSVEILSVRIETGAQTDSESARGINVTKFVLSGNQRFFQLPVFDLFSYGTDEPQDGAPATDGYLRFNGLTVVMAFHTDTPGSQTFSADEGAISFDPVNSIARAASLAANFPVVPQQLILSPNLAKEGEKPAGQTPEDRGYTSIAAPMDQTPMVPSWCGLVFSLDLGTLGALSGSAGLTVTLLAAWSQGTGQGDPPVYLGLKLPNIPAIGGSLPLQGVLKLGFRSFEFNNYDAGEGKVGYMLRLRRFALSVLCWSFPPGNIDVCLFGEPGNPKGSLGWYAAYDDGKSASGLQRPALAGNADALPPPPAVDEALQRRLKSGRRTIPAG